MLQISPVQINVTSHQKRYNIRFVNHSKEALLFKIVSTSWGSFQLDRNAGFMQPESRLQLLLTVNKRKHFKQKLKVMYGNLSDPNDPFDTAWKKLKSSGQNITKEVIVVCFRDSSLNEPLSFQDIRSKSEDKKSKHSGEKKSCRPSIRKHALSPIKEQTELRYLLSKIKKTASSSSFQRALEHIEKERKKHVDQEQREELMYEIEQLERKFQLEVYRSQRLSQQLQIAEKKLQNNSLQILKFQIGHSLGVVCQEYHTSFAGLTVLALAFFVLGYALALI